MSDRMLELLVGSYLHNARQRSIGRRRQLGPLAAVHYDFIWEGRRHTADNFFAWRAEPAELCAAAAAQPPAESRQLFVIGPAPADREEFARRGWRLEHTLHAMSRPPGAADAPADGRWRIDRAMHPAQAAQINALLGDVEVNDEDLADPALRDYLVLEDERCLARGRVFFAAPGLAWISGVHTDPAHRRRGIGAALMRRMLADCQAAGAATSALLSTAMAHGLYRRLGFRDEALVWSLAPEPH